MATRYDIFDDPRVAAHIARLEADGVKLQGTPVAWAQRHIYAAAYAATHLVNVTDPVGLKRQTDMIEEALFAATRALAAAARLPKANAGSDW